MQKYMIGKLLWLDDTRNPMENDWLVFSPIENPSTIWIKSYDEFVDFISKHGLTEAICFDHDLGEEKTGHDCAKWLVEYCMDNNLKLPLWNIQSANPVGKENINGLLTSFKKQTENQLN